MTEPRKEQVNDPKTRFSASPSGFSLGGGTSQTFGGGSYLSWLASTVTGVVGGAETSSPAILRNTVQGPYVLIAGNQFSVTIPGVNAGLPVSVAIQAADIVLVGGAPRVTTSRLAARVNAALLLMGVTYAVASNDRGYLKLVSAVGAAPTTGDTAVITVTDITPGVLNAIGFGFVVSVSASGTTAPKRGIVTVTPDGGGSYVPLRGLGGEPAVSRSTSATSLSVAGTIFVPKTPLGDPVVGRMTGTPTDLTLGYFRQGYLPPRVITSQSDFSSILLTDTIGVTVSDTDFGYSAFASITFSPAPTSAADVVSLLNAGWNAWTGGLGKAHIRSKVPEPYATSGGFLNFSLNGQPTVAVSISDTTATAVAAAINSAIIGAGQAAQGTSSATTASSGDGAKVAIDSLNTSGLTSTVEIFSSSSPDLLDALGFSVGVYTGSTIARLYGLDEVEIFAPFAGPNASITLVTTVFGNLGLPSSPLTVSSVLGEEPYAPPTDSYKALTPEVMRFGEVPAGHETLLESFSVPKEPSRTDPSLGAANDGLPLLLGVLGKIDPSFIPRVLHFLGIDTLQLGADQTGASLNVTVPRVTLPRNSTQGDGVLIAVLEDLAGVQEVIRVYDIRDAVRGDEIVLTRNALFTAGASWLSDNAGSPSGAVRIGKGSVILQHKDATGGLWIDTAWDSPIILDAQKGGVPPVILGTNMGSTAADILTPRVQTVGGTYFELVWEGTSGFPGTVKQRLYSLGGIADGRILFTVNVKLSTTPGTFEKDVAGVAGFGMSLADTGVTIVRQLPANNAPWVSFDQTDVSISPNLVQFFSSLNLLGLTDPVANNTLTPGNIVKAWGVITMSNPGGFGTVVGAVSFNKDYGVVSYALDGFGRIVITLSGTHLTDYDFVMSTESTYAPGPPPASYYNYLPHSVVRAASSVTIAMNRYHVPVGGGAVTADPNFDLTGIEGDTGLAGSWILMARQS